jgi:hypothetical protein
MMVVKTLMARGRYDAISNLFAGRKDVVLSRPNQWAMGQK